MLFAITTPVSYLVDERIIGFVSHSPPVVRDRLQERGSAYFVEWRRPSVSEK